MRSTKARKARSGRQLSRISRRRISVIEVLGDQFQPRLCFVPEGVERGARRFEAARIKLVHVARSVGTMGDKTGLLEEREMARDGRTAHRERGRERAHAERPTREALDDLAA